MDTTENETIESLKDQIFKLEQFILENYSDDSVKSNEEIELNKQKINSLEGKLNKLTNDLDLQKKKFHREELKNRMILQQKLVESKQSSDQQISEYKTTIKALQSKIYVLEEELQYSKSPDSKRRPSFSLYDDFSTPQSRSNVASPSPSNSNVEEYTNNLLSQIDKLYGRIKELEEKKENNSINESKKNSLTVENLQQQINQLKIENEKIKNEKNLIEKRLENCLSEISELESNRSSGYSSSPNKPSNIIDNSNKVDESKSSSSNFVLFYGLIKRKQAAIFGNWLPRLLVIDRDSIEFWAYSPDIEKQIPTVKDELLDSSSVIRRNKLENINLLFRRTIPKYSIAHAEACNANEIDIHYKNGKKLKVKTDSIDLQRSLMRAFTELLV